MILLPDQEVWTSQPQGPDELCADFRKYLTYGFVGGQRLALKPKTELSSIFIPGVNPTGRVLSNNTTQIVLASVADSIMPTGSEVTILFHGRVTSGIGAFIGNGVTTSADFNIFLPYTDGSVYFRWGGEVAGTTALVTAGLTFSETDSFGFSCGPRGMELWQNGKKVNSNLATPSRTADAALAFYLGTQVNAGAISLVKSSLFTIFKKQLPTSVLASRYYWNLFQASNDELVASAGGGAAALAGAAAGVATAAGALTTGIPIAGAAAVVVTATGALSTSIPFLGAAVVTVTAAGDLSAQIKLDGAAIAQALAAGGLDTGISLAAAAAAVATATGDLGAGAALAGVAQAIAAAFGSLTTQIVLSGAAISEALASGDLTAPGSGLSGAAAAVATAGGQLITAIPLAGAAQAYATAAGGLSTIILLDGAAASVSSATGDLTISLTMSGNAIATALATGSLTTLIVLNGAAVSIAAAAGVLGGGYAVIDPTWRTQPKARRYMASPPQREYIGSR